LAGVLAGGNWKSPESHGIAVIGNQTLPLMNAIGADQKPILPRKITENGKVYPQDHIAGSSAITGDYARFRRSRRLAEKL
jgi:hypothetical protein